MWPQGTILDSQEKCSNLFFVDCKEGINSLPDLIGSDTKAGRSLLIFKTGMEKIP